MTSWILEHLAMLSFEALGTLVLLIGVGICWLRSKTMTNNH